MTKLGILFFVFLFLSATMGKAQNLSSHQWNDRLVIIRVKDQSSPLLKSQILELKKSVDGLNDRRIIVYQLIPGKFQNGLHDSENWKVSGGFFEKLKETDAEFEIVLIGLDGGIKLQKNEPLKYEELFGIIDQMPMRRSEIKRDFNP